jgi:ribulose-5-phosphate 4-epimerase/fuculose-1-phosphate aldolase
MPKVYSRSFPKKEKPMFDEGYIKFDCKWEKSNPLDQNLLKNLISWREKLYNLKLIGAYENEIGYGNISERFKGNQFIITGSATGNIPKLNAGHFSKVIDFDLSKNSLTCCGPIKASSESLSHGILYQLDSNINAVIHVHNFDLWEKLLHQVPTTNQEVSYGTPQMAKEIIRLHQNTNLPEQKIFVMEGHEEGIITFGKDLDEAGKVLLNYFLTNPKFDLPL